MGLPTHPRRAHEVIWAAKEAATTAVRALTASAS
jgi:hypothetical protein